ncbi:DUF397 domain-containing protein [Streptomyces shenzhenensis]|uniref:DUF397 domain-containing protein n=1 Tax=Streptomyces shenzhenensis TaxID=943815 RepID=A0A3M0I9F4_9ACTN|nr:DUF397 domain-containing protein [Streptomyces shenzhenensis]
METSRQTKAVTWRKSSYSGPDGGECVEVADLDHEVAVRDSKDPGAGQFAVAPGTWAAFLRELK